MDIQSDEDGGEMLDIEEHAVMLAAMLQCEDRGDLRTLRGHLRDSGETVIANGDGEQLRQLSRMLIRMVNGIDHEARHGKGSLMKWDHPVNAMMLERGFLLKQVPATT